MQKIIAAAILILSLGVPGLVAAQQASGDLDLQYRQRMEERLSAQDRQMRNLTGLVEQLQNTINQTNKRVAKLEADVAALKQAAAAPPAATLAPPAATLAPPAPAPTASEPAAAPAANSGTMSLPAAQGDPQKDYEAAFALLSEGKYGPGETAFRAFVEQHPGHALTSNARYWIGETLYARGRYQDAGAAFLAAWQGDASGPKAPDNLLKLGMSLAQLNKKTEACVSFNKLLSDYSGAAARVRSAARREIQSLGCS